MQVDGGAIYPNNDKIFQQNNVPLYWEQINQNWFEEHSDEWCSPDMSPIKHLWNVLERSICMKDPVPTNINYSRY